MGRNPRGKCGGGKETQCASLGLRSIPGNSTSKRILDSSAGRVEHLDDTLFIFIRAKETELLGEVMFDDNCLCKSCGLKTKKIGSIC
jgi:hypothetical protein